VSESDRSQQSSVSAGRDRFDGGSIVSAAALFVLVLCAAILSGAGTGEEGTRVAVRATARTSMLFFCLAYVAGAVRSLWPGRFADWLVRNQRYLGFALGVSHAAHALFLWRLFAFGYEPFDLAGAAGGLVGYAFLAAMLATSNAPARQWLGARRWKRLHTVGMHYLWIAFTSTMAGAWASTPDGFHVFFTLLGVVALFIRLAGAVREHRSGLPASAPGL